ncbi:MAG: DUF1302 family protein [Woeseia sp.]
MRYVFLVSLACLVCSIANSAGLQSAELRAELLYGYSTAASSTLEAGLELEPAFEYRFGDTSRLVFSARLRWDAEDHLAPGKPDVETYDGASRPWTVGSNAVAEMRDAYLQIDLPRGLLRIGKQQIAWGALDGLKIMDSLNPQNFREFILEDFADSRIGLWSVYADVTRGNWRAELAWIPDTTGHEIPAPGAWFELVAPRFRYGAEPDAPRPPTTTIRPDSTIDDATIGVRIARLLGGWDLGLVAISGYDFEPLGRLVSSPTGPVLERYHARRELLGISAGTSLGAVAMRAEVSYRPERMFNLRDGTELVSEPLDQYSVGLGIDISGPFDTFINLQYVLDHVQSAPDTLVRPRTDRLVTLLLRRNFAYDTVTTELRWYRDAGKGDELLRAALAYVIGEETSLRLGLDVFRGDADGLFGQFNDRDRITLSVEHYF